MPAVHIVLCATTVAAWNLYSWLLVAAATQEARQQLLSQVQHRLSLFRAAGAAEPDGEQNAGGHLQQHGQEQLGKAQERQQQQQVQEQQQQQEQQQWQEEEKQQQQLGKRLEMQQQQQQQREVQGSGFLLIIVDDTNHLASMRRDFLKIARQGQVSTLRASHASGCSAQTRDRGLQD